MEERDGIQDRTEEMGSESVNVQISVNKAVAMEFSNIVEYMDVIANKCCMLGLVNN